MLDPIHLQGKVLRDEHIGVGGEDLDMLSLQEHLFRLLQRVVVDERERILNRRLSERGHLFTDRHDRVVGFERQVGIDVDEIAGQIVVLLLVTYIPV